MAVDHSQVHNYRCDIPDCTEAQTVVGDDPETILNEMGWDWVEIFDKHFDLCPMHTKELKEFLFEPEFGLPDKDAEIESSSNWLDPRQAAHYLGVTPNTLRNWNSAGKLKAYRVGDKLVRYLKEDLDKMMVKVDPAEFHKYLHADKDVSDPGAKVES